MNIKLDMPGIVEQWENMIDDLQYVLEVVKADVKSDYSFYTRRIVQALCLRNELLACEKLQLRKLRQFKQVYIEIKSRWMEEYKELADPASLHNSLVTVTRGGAMGRYQSPSVQRSQFSLVS